MSQQLRAVTFFVVLWGCAAVAAQQPETPEPAEGESKPQPTTQPTTPPEGAPAPPLPAPPVPAPRLGDPGFGEPDRPGPRLGDPDFGTPGKPAPGRSGLGKPATGLGQPGLGERKRAGKSFEELSASKPTLGVKNKLAATMPCPASGTTCAPSFRRDGGYLDLVWLEREGEGTVSINVSRLEDERWGPPEEILRRPGIDFTHDAAPRLGRMQDGREVVSWVEQGKGGAKSLWFSVRAAGVTTWRLTKEEPDPKTAPAATAAPAPATGETPVADAAAESGVVAPPAAAGAPPASSAQPGAGTPAESKHPLAGYGAQRYANGWGAARELPPRAGTVHLGACRFCGPARGGLGFVWLRQPDPAAPPAADDAATAATADTVSMVYARIDSSGFAAEEVLQRQVCGRCAVATASTATERYVVFRDCDAAGLREIVLLRECNGYWEPPLPISQDRWQAAECPQQGPAVAAMGRRVAVAWFSGGEEPAKVFLRTSEDSGRTYGAAKRMSIGKNAGKVACTWRGNGTAVVAWTVDTEPGVGVFASEHLGGRTSKVLEVSDPGSTVLGYPVMESAGNEVYVAWTDQTIGVRTARIFSFQF